MIVHVLPVAKFSIYLLWTLRSMHVPLEGNWFKLT